MGRLPHPTFEVAESNLLGAAVQFSGSNLPRPASPIDRWVTEALRANSLVIEDRWPLPPREPYRDVRSAVCQAVLLACSAQSTNDAFVEKGRKLKEFSKEAHAIAEKIKIFTCNSSENTLSKGGFSKIQRSIDDPDFLSWRAVMPPGRVPEQESREISGKSVELLASAREAGELFTQIAQQALKLAELQKPFRTQRDGWLIVFCDAMLDSFFYLFQVVPGAPETKGFQDFVADAYRSAVGDEGALPDGISSWVIRRSIQEFRFSRGYWEQPDRFFHPEKKISYDQRKLREKYKKEFDEFQNIKEKFYKLQSELFFADTQQNERQAQFELVVMYLDASEGVQKMMRDAGYVPPKPSTEGG